MVLVVLGVIGHLLVNVSDFSTANRKVLDKGCIDLFVATCPPLNSITDGSISYSRAVEGNGEYLSGSVATFSCSYGYELSEDTTRTCQDNHMWTGTDPSCQSKDKYFTQCILSMVCVHTHPLNARILQTVFVLFIHQTYFKLPIKISTSHMTVSDFS